MSRGLRNTIRAHESVHGEKPSHVTRVGVPNIAVQMERPRGIVVYRELATGREWTLVQSGNSTQLHAEAETRWVNRTTLRRDFELLRRPQLTQCACKKCRCPREQVITPQKPVCFPCFSNRHDGVPRAAQKEGTHV